jgi:uncharacterized RDD family membrane protein YckC
MKDHVYAGFWIRVGANLIDLIILLVLFSALSGLSMLIFSDRFFGVIGILFQYVIPFILTIWFWLKFQATPGKMATNLRVVDAFSGNTLTKGQAIGRYFAQILSMIPFGLGYFWIVIDKKNQSWHDKLAGSVVIRSFSVEKVVFEGLKNKMKDETQSST